MSLSIYLRISTHSLLSAPAVSSQELDTSPTPMNKDQIENLESEILNGLAEIEALEARKTPALAGPGTIFGGVLTLHFDKADDTIIVSQDDDTISVAYIDNKGHADTLTFEAEGTLHKLVIDGGAGND